MSFKRKLAGKDMTPPLSHLNSERQTKSLQFDVWNSFQPSFFSTNNSFEVCVTNGPLFGEIEPYSDQIGAIPHLIVNFLQRKISFH